MEAELFEEYDAMVPGPAAAATLLGNNAPGGAGGQERTGRPLKINLDLLSYQAKQKNIKVCFCFLGWALCLPASGLACGSVFGLSQISVL